MMKTYPTRSPNMLWWIITSDCNLACQHCYLSSYEKNSILPEEQWNEVLKQAYESGIKKIFLTGGEPFLLNLKRLFTLCSDYNISVTGIETNGTLIDAGLAKELVRQNTLLYVSYDKFHDDKSQTEINIEHLTGSGNKVYINTVISNDNVDSIEKIYKRIKTMDINGWRLFIPTKIGSAKSIIIPTVEKEIETYRNVMELWLEDDRPFELSLGSLMSNRRDGKNKCVTPKYTCQYFSSVITILPDGRLLPCCRFIEHPDTMKHSKTIFEEPMVKQLKNSVLRNVKYRKIQDLTKKSENKECKTCNLLNICQMGCSINAYLESGCLDIHEKRHCVLMKKYYMGMFKKYDYTDNHIGGD